MNVKGIMSALQAREISPEDAARRLAALRRSRTESTSAPKSDTARAPSRSSAQWETTSVESLMGELTASLAEALYVDPSALREEQTFTELGLDSIIGVEWLRAINGRYGLTIPATRLYDHPTLRQLAQLVAQELAQKTGCDAPAETAHAGPGPALAAPAHAPMEPEMKAPGAVVSLAPAAPRADGTAVAGAAPTIERRAVDEEAIAIVGMSGGYPGASSLAQFWANLSRGVNSIKEIPPSRWDVNRYYDPRPNERGKMYCKWLGVLDDVESFDPLFFNISPAEAEVMDPQHRIFLQEAYRAFEDAGYGAAQLSNSKCGVYLGIMSNEYSVLVQRAGSDRGNGTGNSNAIAAARISYFLNLRGPAISIDTACSSSLVAIHLACQALRTHEIDFALAGGVTLYLAPEAYLGMCGAGMLSPDGQCKTFDNDADGFVPGEGAGALVLKRLRDAEADGDHIHGVIIGSGINQDGKTNGITAPSVQSQIQLEREIYTKYGIHPETISYIETHGTGTKLGDPIELEALATVFEERTSCRNYCALGSVKSNIGHTSAAAGVAGVHKVLLGLRHGMLVPTLNFTTPNEHFDFQNSPFYANTVLKPWESPTSTPRRAAVSSFGFSGTNAHLVIEEYVPAAQTSSFVGGLPSVFVLSARTAEQLGAQAANLRAYLETSEAPDLPGIAYTLQIGRDALEHRLAIVAETRETLLRALDDFCDKGAAPNAYVGCVKRGEHAEGLLGADHDAQMLLQAWAEKRQTRKIAQAWTKGATIDWNRSYGRRRPRRVALPTYPFAKERYWVNIGAAAAPHDGASGDRWLHPLLKENTSNLSAQRFSSVFTGEEALLRDHRVGGRRIFPAAGYIEMARAALERAFGDEHWPDIVLRDVVFRDALAIAESTQVHIELWPQSACEVRFQIHSEANGETRVHAQGSMESGTADAPTIDIEALQACCAGPSVSADTCYAAFGRMGIEYGATYRGIVSIRRGRAPTGERLALAQLAASSTNTAGSSPYGVDPGLLDSALQATIGLADENSAEAMPSLELPFAVERIDVLGPCANAAIAVVREAGSAGAVRKVDIDLCGADGSVCLRVRGFSTRSVASASTADQTLLLVPADLPEPAQSTDGVAGHAAHWVLICMPAGQSGQHIYMCEEYRSRIESAIRGVNCRVLEAAATDTAGRFIEQAEAVLETLQGILATRPHRPVLIQLVVDAREDGRLFAGMAGFATTVRLESPLLQMQYIEIEGGETPEALVDRLRANQARAEDVVIRYPGAERHVSRLRESEQAAGGMPFKDGGVYLIAGGAGGLGLLFAQEIAARTRSATLILVGRSPLDDPKRERIAAIEAAGARVVHESVDITDGAAVERLLTSIVTRFGKLDGILHTAGVLRDGFLVNKTASELRAVLAAKVDGAIHLDAASRDLDLDFFVLFSSAAGVFGNVGQADYAVANAFLDAFARRRQERVAGGTRRGRTLSINWPYWAGGGMRLDDESVRLLRQRSGAAPLTHEAGMRAFEAAFALAAPQVLVLHGDAERFRRTLLVRDDGRRASAAPPSEGPADDRLREATVGYLKRRLSAVLKLAPERFAPDAPFERYGIDSVVVMQLTIELERDFGALSKTLFFEYQTLAELADYFVRSHATTLAELVGVAGARVAPVVHQPAAMAGLAPSRAQPRLRLVAPAAGCGTNAPFDIAIVGLSGRYPQARNVEEFWENLKQGRDCISEVPKDRWDHELYFHPEKGKPGKTYTKWGGFLADVDKFDARFFGISPREAEGMDPQERLFLQCAYETLEDAGYTRESLRRYAASGLEASVGVFVGVMYEEYQLYGAQAQATGKPFALSGSAASIANRVSHFLNLHGPSLAVDSMCSSSLTAIHLARQSLLQGDCEVAIAGGVNVSVHPNKYLGLAQGQFASSKGRCESFGQGGDGYVPGEGVGAILLKPLQRAIEDGDHIYGVIKGSAINHGGKTNGYTVPNPLAQANVIARALKGAGVPARALTYVEAHGTGTSLGDPIEIAGLTRAFAEQTNDVQYCAIGSAKSNIGHLESAAGIAGVTKVLLQMKHRFLAPSLHADVLNPNIDFAASPFAVQRHLEEWRRPRLLVDGQEREYPRLAGVSSFGAGGANAHLVIEEYLQRDERPAAALDAARPALLVLSGKNEERLRAAAQRLREFLHRADVPLADIAYTLQVGREAAESRLAFTCLCVEEACKKLDAFLAGRAAPELWYADIRRPQDVLTLFDTDEVLREAIDKWIGRGRYARLLELWANGASIDWERLYAAESPYAELRPRRVSLPTYPFAAERYWIEMPALAADANHDSRAAAAALAETLHPLLHRNTSTFELQRFTSVFTGEERFLADHVVQGQALLPGVCYLEMMRAAVAHSLDVSNDEPLAERGMTLKNIVWSRPCAVRGSRSIDIVLSPEADGTIGCEVLESGADESDDTVYAQAIARVSSLSPETVGLEQLQALPTVSALTREECYRAFAAAGIAYGHAHQVIDRLERKQSPEGAFLALAALTLPAGVDDRAYRFHPSLLDGALQAALGLSANTPSEPLLPFALDELTLLAPLPPACRAIVTARDASAESSLRKFDITICDGEGNVRARMNGLTARVAKAAAPTATPTAAESNASPVGALALVPLWKMVAPPAQTEPVGNGPIVVIDGEHLQEVDRVPAARRLNVASRASIDELVDALREAGELAHLVWAPSRRSSPAIADDSLIDGQEEGAVAGFRLIKALLALGHGKRSLEITIVTSATQTFGRTTAADPTHASLWGLFGSLAKEQPLWRVRLVETSSTESLPLAQAIAPSPEPSGEPWLYRHGQWHRQSLALADIEAPAATRFRQGGVYVVVGGAGGLGEALSEYLIATYQARMIWIGRRDKDASIQAKLDRLAMLGPAPEYLALDATDGAALRQAVERIKRRHGAVHGVVHSALVLADKALANMDEATFRASLRAKIDVSVRLAQAVASEPLDFLLFFSSMQSFTKAAGQANYAAGCTFKDAFARRLAACVPFPVKVVNWGYWGSVGIVASPAYQERMAKLGIGSIECEEAMATLERLLASSAEQLAFLKIAKPNALAGSVCLDERVHVSAGNQPCVEAMLCERTLPPPAIEDDALARMRDFDEWTARLLYAQLHSLGAFSASPIDLDAWTSNVGLIGLYASWLQESLRVLTERGYLERNDRVWRLAATAPTEPAAITAQWQHARCAFEADPHIAAQCRLVETALAALPDILSGKRQAPHVLFPNSSMELLEGVYKNNRIADYFNEALADTLAAYVQTRLAREPGARLRLLEIGAGTGGTSAMVFAKLAPYAAHIEEYCYTDVSKSFLIHAEQTYRSRAPYLACRPFDVELPLAAQSISPGSYDITIAANVLHATRDIRRTLRNVKATLRADGLLLLNEISRESLFAHLTFGLLEGWWRYEDRALRLPGSPALAPAVWRTVLDEEGFQPVFFPCAPAQALGQQIVAAQSDGVVRHERPPVVASPPARALAPKATQTTASNVAPLVQQLQAGLIDAVAELLKFDRDAIDIDAELSEFGFDSITMTAFATRLGETFGIDINPTVFFEHPTIRSLTQHLSSEYNAAIANKLALPVEPPTSPLAMQTQSLIHDVPPPLRFARRRRRERHAAHGAAAPAAVPRGAPEPIAIVGVSGAFPMAPDVETFWRNLEAGKDCISEVPASRWDWRALYGDPQKEPNRTNIKWGGFMEGIEHFDPLFFGISPREAEVMDPQQRLLMIHAWRVIEDAGYAPQSLSGSKTALLVGTGATGYGEVIARANLAIEGYSATSVAPSLGPNRVSYLLNLHGPSEPIETACSSALVAIHRAVALLQSRECDMAIAGGINTLIAPGAHISFSKAGMLAEDGRCKTFSKHANGYVRGEGVGLVLLKRLAAAERDGDHIYALIRGSSENHGGRANSLTAPNPKAQAELIKEAYLRAGIDPRTVTYIEAHGTGTALGDPIEVNGLKSAFKDLYAATGDSTVTRAHCGIGAVKTHIGHLELAAGAAGLIKVLLQLKYQTLIKNLHGGETNPYLDLSGSPFYLVNENQPWEPPRAEDGSNLPRRAGVSSFGFGGVNAHVVIEEYVAGVAAPAAAPEIALIVLSAKNDQRLKEAAQALLAALRSGRYEDADLSRIAYTLQIGRDPMESRLAVIVRSLAELAEKLERFLSGATDTAGLRVGHGKGQKDTLELFTADEELQDAVAKWIERGKYETLAELWAKGLAFDWSRLYGETKPKRISLPTYPFAKERYWTDPAAGARADAANGAANAPRRTRFDAAFYEHVLDALASDALDVETAVAKTRAQDHSGLRPEAV